MSIVDRLYGRLASEIAKRIDQGYRFNIYPGVKTPRQGLGERANQKELIRSFKSIVFACVHARAKEVAAIAGADKIRAVIERRPGSVRPVPLTHPLSELLANPNPVLTRYYLWYLSITYLDLTGNSYWWVAKDRMNVPRAVWPIPSDKVRIVPGNPSAGESLIRSYEIEWDPGNKVPVPEEEIVHLRHPNPADPYYYGSSLVMKAAYEVDIDQFITAHQREFFANDATPAGIITFPNLLDETTRKAFEDQWQRRFHRKPGQIGYLEGGATYQPMVNQKELDYLESTGTNRHKIQAIFGVPDSKLMIEENIMARATMDTLDYNFIKETIDPLLTMLDEQLTLDLARQLFDPKLKIMHDNVIPKDLKLEAELDKARIETGQRTINELRDRDGLSPFEGADEPLVPINLVPLSAVVGGETEEEPVEAPDVENPDEAPESDAEDAQDSLSPSSSAPNAEEASSSEAEKGSALSERMKRTIWVQHDRMRGKWERHMSYHLSRFFSKIRRDAVRYIGTVTQSLKQDAGDYLVDLSMYEEQLMRLVGREGYLVMRSAFDQFIREHDIEGTIWRPNDPLVIDGITRLANKTRSVLPTLREGMARQIDEGLARGETAEQLKQRLDRWMASTQPSRTQRIARTNVNYSLNRGNELAARRSLLFDRKMWVTQRDRKVRFPLHAALDGTVVPLNGKFELLNGDLLSEPGDPSASKPESVVNCRCVCAYLPKE